MEHRDMNTKKNNIRYFLTKDETIVKFLNNMPKEDITKAKIDRSRLFSSANQMRRKKRLVKIVDKRAWILLK